MYSSVPEQCAAAAAHQLCGQLPVPMRVVGLVKGAPTPTVVRSGVEWSGVEWSGVEWSGVEWVCCAVLCCAVLCCAVPCRAVPCRLTRTDERVCPKLWLILDHFEFGA